MDVTVDSQVGRLERIWEYQASVGHSQNWGPRHYS